ncbi:hypothetical protein FACS1894116_12680 [Betaproteobacteria bacterium]|nr:hypothetical protein FACS1894116_12680 [Betaproteobacteria bacterium]
MRAAADVEITSQTNYGVCGNWTGGGGSTGNCFLGSTTDQTPAGLTGKTVEVTGAGGTANVNNYIAGARGVGASSPITGNTVTVDTNGTIAGGVYGSYSFNTNANSPASGNFVNIRNGTFSNQAISCGYADINTSSGNDAIANDNTVNIEGSSMNVSIYGGYVVSSTFGGINATATNNTINIYNSPTLTTSSLYGGRRSTNFIGRRRHLHWQHPEPPYRQPDHRRNPRLPVLQLLSPLDPGERRHRAHRNWHGKHQQQRHRAVTSISAIPSP